MAECVLPIISAETIGSSVYCNIPLSLDAEASLNALLISSMLVDFLKVQVKSVSDPFGTGTRIPAPKIFL